MARPRTPKAKAEVSGATSIHPGRFKGRSSPKSARPVGDPYVRMTEAQQEAWRDLADNMPWLNSAHRPLLRLACIWMAKMDEGDFGVSATKALSAILSKLGATPTDESKVSHGGEDDEDPSDKFFARPH